MTLLTIDGRMMPAPAPLANAALGFKAPVNVRARHVRIMALRREGWSLNRIALKVGLWGHSAVRYHTAGQCRCEEATR